MPRLRIALCQVNAVVGDLEGNAERVRRALDAAEAQGCDLAVMPEMVINGYPPEDLVLKPGFVRDGRAVLEKLAASTGDCAVIVGFADGGEDGAVFNGAAVCAGGRVVGIYHKRELPNYDLFDEARHFVAGDQPLRLFSIGGVRVGVSICEDLWIPGGPVNQLAAGGAELIVNINGSPFRQGKVEVRERVLGDRIEETGRPIVYLNLVGGQDEAVFDGGSMVVAGSGVVRHRSAQFVESVDVVDVDVPVVGPAESDFPTVPVTEPRSGRRPDVATRSVELADESTQLYQALVLATRDYVHKSGFTDVCIGLSGGIDSSLVAAIATDALGPEQVHGVLMPSRFSSDHSVTDATELATRLGIQARTIPIEAAHAAFLELLAPSFEGREAGLTEENLQSRIRGVVLMALSNKFGWLVLTTGNKSEAAVGYSTLYGDTAGAYAVIKDVYKLGVYELCRWRNRQPGGEVIPESVITKPPSAELRPDQRDDQSLPSYDLLDPLLEAYIEGDRNRAELVQMGFDAELVHRITRLVDVAEFKRRQTPLGARVTSKGFGRDRRLPIVNSYRG